MIKKLVLFFTLILIYGCHGIDINDPNKRNENWVYWIDQQTGEASWVPVTNHTSTLKDGRYTSFYTKGSIYKKGKLKNGKEVDTIYFYDLEEKIIQYLLVKHDTLIHYYLNNGPYISYFQNGKVFEKGIIENHKIGDEWTKYYDNGKIDWTKKLENGTGWNYWYYDNGQLSVINYHLNGKTHGEVKTWYKNGQIKEVSNWNNGLQDGNYQSFYENGQLKEKLNLIKNNREGINEKWYENGQKEQVQFYENDLIHGEVLQWYPNGNRKSKMKLIFGKIDGEITTYFKNGQIKRKGFFMNGTRNGLFVHYDEKGNITLQEEYIHGQLMSN